MVGTLTANKKQLDRLRAAFKRYGTNVLGDQEIAIDFFPTEFDGFFEVLLTSPNFQKMEYTERQNSIWDYLSGDPEITKDDLFCVTQIATETEAVELI
jgi:hypothetical protein